MVTFVSQLATGECHLSAVGPLEGGAEKGCG